MEIRRAEKEDREAVLKIRDHVYDGNDYLPTYYDHFLSSSDFMPFVMILDGNIIGFEVIQTVDDGRNMVGRAKRINPKFEGQGYVKQFSASLDDWKKKNKISLTAFTASDANQALTKPSFKSVYRLVQTRQMPLYLMDVLSTTLSDNDIKYAMELTTVSEAQLSGYFASSQIKEYLSEEGRMIIDMVPLKLIQSNIRYMTGPQGFTSVFSDVRIENGICRGLLSFGSVFPVQRPPFHCNLDIFGSDTSTLKSHIVRHLMVMKTKVTDVVGVLVMVQEDFDMEQLDNVFKDFGVDRKIWYDSLNPELRYSQLYLYEKDE